MELRQDFGDAALGTCLESLIGGNHLRSAIQLVKRRQYAEQNSRVFRQNGTNADSGALFLAYVNRVL